MPQVNATSTANWSYNGTSRLIKLGEYRNPQNLSATCSSITVLLGTGDGTFNYNQTVTGYGNPLTTHLSVNSDSGTYTSSDTTITKVIRPLRDSQGTYPDRWSCDPYTFVFSSAIVIPPYSTITIYIQGVGGALVFYRDASNAITLDVSWDNNTYTISYDSNGGSPAEIPSQEKPAGETVYIYEGEITREDYTFDYWEDDKGVVWLPGQAYTEDADLHLTAHWTYSGPGPDPTAGTYIVSYNSFGGTYVASTIGKIEAIYETDPETGEIVRDEEGNPIIIGYRNVPVTLGGPPTRTVYLTFNFDGGSGSPSQKSAKMTFQGWKDSRTGSTYQAGDSYNAGTTTMTAIWSSVRISGFPTPIRNNCRFDGWFSSPSRTGSAITSYTFSGSSTNNYATIYTRWLYRVWYTLSDMNPSQPTPPHEPDGDQADDGNLDIADQWKSYNTELALSGVSPMLPGYEFIGWSRSAKPIPSDSADYSIPNPVLPANINEPVELFPTFKYGYYTITFDPNGGSWDGDSEPRSQIVRSGQSAVVEPDPTWVGHVFRGWAGKYSNVITDATIFAVWDNSPVWIYSPTRKWVPYLHYSDYINGVNN